jgi:hypothetical protein
MTIGARQRGRGKKMGFEVHIRVTHPDGTSYRVCIRAPLGSKSAVRALRFRRRKSLSTVPEAAPLLRTRPKAIYGPVECGQVVGVACSGRRVLAHRHLLLHVLDEKAATIAGK